MSEGQPGFGWALLLRGGGGAADLYYLISEWGSEEALNRAAVTPEKRACIDRHQPYQYMVRSPAFREVVEVITDEREGLAAGSSDLDAVHRLVDDDSQPLVGSPARRLLLQVVAEPHRRYEVTLWERGQAPAGAPLGELMLSLPRGEAG